MDFNIDARELQARLGSDMDVSEHIDKFNSVVKFKFAYVRVPVIIKENVCDFGFAKVESESLSKVLIDSNEAFIFAVTAGAEVDRLISKLYLQSTSNAFIVDAIASAAIESFADHINEKICEGLNTTKRFSPGYADFPLSFQSDLLNRIDSKRTLGITLSEKLLMLPQKSISAVIGIKNEKH